MSASNKKKLRKEQEMSALTDKQRAQQKEEKKLKGQTIAFISIILVVVIAFLAVVGINAYKKLGLKYRMTVAAVTGDHKISTVEMNYYYKDSINSTYEEWSASFGDMTDTYVLYYLNLDTSKPLNEQVRDDGTTWADYFMEMALEKIKSDYAFCDRAKAEGFKLTKEQKKAIKEEIKAIRQVAGLYGFGSANEFMRYNFGEGSTLRTYKQYLTRTTLAQAYYDSYAATLSYDDAALRAYEADKYNTYSSYNYALYYVNYEDFLPNEKDEEGKAIEPSSEEIGDARGSAEETATALTESANLEEFNAAIAALEFNKDKDVSATESLVLYENLTEEYKEWLTSADRKENDMFAFPNEVSKTDDDGNTIESVDGYNVIMFLGRNDNNYKAANVRHLLVKFQGGTTDANGVTTYSDEEKAAAKATAEGYMNTWVSNGCSEQEFIDMVKAYSEDTGSVETGGLYENITWETTFVPEFLDWSLAEGREAGNYGIIETTYGYHIMYYSSSSEMTYRDTMVYNALMQADLEAWYNEIVGSATAVYGDTSLIDTALIISPATTA